MRLSACVYSGATYACVVAFLVFQWILSWFLYKLMKKKVFRFRLELENSLPTFQLNAAVVVIGVVCMHKHTPARGYAPPGKVTCSEIPSEATIGPKWHCSYHLYDFTCTYDSNSLDVHMPVAVAEQLFHSKFLSFQSR